MDKSHAFRDDLAAQRIAIFGYDPGAVRDTGAIFGSDPDPEEDEDDDQAVDFFAAGCAEQAAITHHAWGTLSVTPASPEKRAARVSDLVTITVNICADPWPDIYRRLINDLLCVVDSDEPGIAAMAAKSVQPTPEPVVSIGGEQVTESEIAQALQLLRAKNAPAVKESPRGLLCVRDFDHRLGSWGA